MTNFRFSNTRPEHWDDMCSAHGALFGSGAWQELLQRSFRCRTIYACDDGKGFVVSVFRGGPFGIGYLGFPIGGGIGAAGMEMQAIESLQATEFDGLPVCVRMPVSTLQRHGALDLPKQDNPETVIENLQAWGLDRVSKNLRRDIRKAERTGLTIGTAESMTTGSDLFAIYSYTVRRHGGALRYNETYFSELLKLAKVQPRLQVLIARHGEDTAGFVVIARHGSTAYYLHSGADPDYRQSSPSDLLLHRAICDARQNGCEQFNLMASPRNQPLLVRYKEKWGGITYEQHTYVLALRRTYRLFQIAERIYGLIRR